MAGEDRDRRAATASQPGGRPPAPGRLALVQAFVNTHYDLELDHGAELLKTPAALAGWLRDRDLIAGRAIAVADDLRHALDTREALRRLAAVAGDGADAVAARDALDELARGAPVEVRFGPGGPSFVPAGDGVRGAIGVLLALAAEAMLDGSWARLKVCPGERCGWAFYDHSRNQAGRWCSMAVCGGRAKARAHYHRRLEAP
jgi:predicted RNA-binding Zn ribbon-like protein